MSHDLVLVVDDEADILQLIKITLARMQIECDTASTLAQAKDLLKQKKYFLCLTDMRLPDGDGLSLVEEIAAHYPKLPVAVITAFGNMEVAVSALKKGAFDFVAKPLSLKILRDLVNTAMKLHKLKAKLTAQIETLIGNSEQIILLRSNIEKLARSQAPVMLIGESGTGKELAAKAIHHKSARRDQPFIAVNCGAIPTELMESEFFGHTKGSFTGALQDKIGLFQAAEGGTLFLDEISDLPLHMQVKLLRAIQEKSIRPIGSSEEISVDVRILSAAHTDLTQEVKNGKFRQDLYYRINVIELRLPPLREHPADIPLLSEHFLQKISEEMHIQKPELTDKALKIFEQYHFPGNVRELENILARAVALSENHVIDAKDIQLHNTEKITQDNSLEDKEKALILATLQKHKGDKNLAAEELGLSLRALRYRLKKWQIT